MLKLILLGIGFIFLFEGLVYFFISKNIKIIFEKISLLHPQKIRTFSSVLIIFGLCIIYFTFKNYRL